MAYIKKENAIKAMNKAIHDRTWSMSDVDVMEQMEEYVEKLPAADVVEVVRCKDCKHSRAIDKNKSPEKYFKPNCVVCECEDVVGDEPIIYLPTHFCSYGERKDV